MNFLKSNKTSKFVTFLAAILLIGCTPKFNWREVRGTDAPFVVVMPAKPETYARPIRLGDVQVTMTMTASEVDGMTFAVGTATLPDASKAVASIHLMKSALVNNISGTIRKERVSGSTQHQVTSIDLEIVGASTASSSGQPRLMVARLIAKDNKVYQALVVGLEKSVTPEALDTFFTSLNLN